MTNFLLTALTQITTDPGQPRRYYDEQALAELTDSIREKGILQPILLRPFNDQYMIVCGERRFRAASAAGLTEIPAIIREMSDDEALELQIIENLQRKDVHPLEEAVAFKSLLDKGKDIKEIAARVGKSEFYARQRIKLTALSSDWQTVFFANRLSVTDALKVALFDEKVQAALWKEQDNRNTIDLGDWVLRKYGGFLKEASFDITDPTLDKRMGPCTTCPFNSAVASLFPDEGASPKCSNISCFNHKSNIHFDRELKNALEDPSVILVNSGWGEEGDQVKRLKKDGHQILKQYTDFTLVEEPQSPDWEDFTEDNGADDDAKAEFQRLLDQYAAEKQDYYKKVDSGKFKKAFQVAGDKLGCYCYIQLKGGSTVKSSSDTKSETAEIDSEITRINDREKRAKELDAEKVHVLLVGQIAEHPAMKSADLPATDTDKILVRFLLFEHVDYNNREAIKKFTGIGDSPYNLTIEERRKYFFKLASLTDHQIAFVIRKVLMSKYGSHLPQMAGGTALRLLAESLPEINIHALESAQNAIALKRQQRVDKKIAELKQQKKVAKVDAVKIAKPQKKATLKSEA